MCCTVIAGTIFLSFLAAGTFLFEYSYLITLTGGTVGPVLFFYILKKVIELRQGKLPPGPVGWPILGSLVEFNLDNALLKCEEYAKKYGKIFSLSMGDFNVVVINDYKLIHEALRREEFQGKPEFEAWNLRNGGHQHRGILLTDGNKTWREQRSFALQNLKDFGFGKQSMEGLLLHEAQQLVNVLKASAGEPVELKHSFNASVLNSLWYIVSGNRFQLDDPKFQKLMSLMSGHIDKAGLFSPALYFPWPSKLNLIRPGAWAQTVNMVETTLETIDELINEHLDKYNENETKDFIDAYLHKHMNSTGDSSFGDEEGLRNLRISLLDLFQAGSETTSTTLVWAVWFMSKNPLVQRKLQNEIDTVIGGSRLPSRDDRARMPYVEAFMNEVHRKASIVPMAVYHRALEDCKFGGYTVKRNTVVYTNLYAAHHDEKFWGDPINFRPERFLDPTETRILPKEALMPFGSGKRICLGETLARDTFFLFITTLLQNFSFRLDPQTAYANVDIPKPNFISGPYDYKVILSVRKSKSF